MFMTDLNELSKITGSRQVIFLLLKVRKELTISNVVLAMGGY
jgi:hypothetical protein